MALGTLVNGKVIAVTGGARGIGLATAKTLHGLGAKVAIGDIDEVAVKQTRNRPRSRLLRPPRRQRPSVVHHIPRRRRARTRPDRRAGEQRGNLSGRSVCRRARRDHPTDHGHQHLRRHSRDQTRCGAHGEARQRPHHQHRVARGDHPDGRHRDLHRDQTRGAGLHRQRAIGAAGNGGDCCRR